MQNLSKIIICFSMSAILLHSCVPARKLEEEKVKRETCEKDFASLKSANQDCEAKLADLKLKMIDNEKTIDGLKRDTAIIGGNIKNLTTRYDKLNQVNEQLLSQVNKISQNNASENTRLIKQLQTTQEELIKKQDELKSLEKDLNNKKMKLDELTIELQKREARVKELEDVLSKKDAAVNELKKKVSDALLGFENKGLTITQKNGKVYVSLDESLLFSSGSTKVEEKGVEALKKLAKVLEQNTEINVLVEGHTDDVPMKGAGEIKDNWDLSVMRATSIVKIITSNSQTSPKRLTAAGRGEYFPIDPAKTPEARKKNRRTEIILTPKLDELLKVLETN